ncbi:helix-turn-helix transcriptional regulator [Pirellulaceae bacterium SH449]
MSNEPRIQNEDSQLITIQEVASLLRLSVRSVRRLISRGDLSEPLKIGRSVRWKKRTIQEWIDQGCNENSKKT